jgi:predicted phage terminase large subunit-like protein
MTSEALDLKYLETEFVERARTDLLAFTMYTKEDYRINWHHRAISDKLNAFAKGDIKFLMVFMPPRHGKSELVSRRFPAFLHGLYPDTEIMAASYLDSLAGDMTVDVQSIIDSPAYKAVFPNTKIYPSGVNYTKGVRNSTEHHIVGTKKGKYRGQGVGGSFTGKGANFIIIDDPIKGREAADSVAFRERLWSFWKDDLFSRLETDLKNGRQGQVLITQTRWHEDDLSGRLIAQMAEDPKAIQWDIVEYPAIKVNDRNPNDRRKIGEALWPSKYNIDQLNQIKATSGPRGWASLYQQSPIIDGGGLFSGSMFEYATMHQVYDFTFITGDTAYTDKQESDYTVLAAWGFKYDKLFLIDVFRRQIKASEVEIPAVAFMNKHAAAWGFRGAYIEPKGHGIYLNQRFRRLGLIMPSEGDVDEFFKDRRLNKTERANNAVPYLSTRKVYINQDIAIKDDLVAEVLAFPKGKHDDFVDCLVDAVKKVYSQNKVSILDVL